MEWLDKIIGWLKIPLKILLPGLCIFSGFIMFASDNLIDKLYLKEFRQQTGFAFGLIFVITLSLMLVYIIVFASKPYINKLKNLQNKNSSTKFDIIVTARTKKSFTPFPSARCPRYVDSGVNTR